MAGTMTHTSTATVAGILAEIQIVPVVVLDDPAGANELADALVAGGIPCAEITFRTPAGLEALKALRGRTDLLLGAGTVLNAADVDLAADAGEVHRQPGVRSRRRYTVP